MLHRLGAGPRGTESYMTAAPRTWRREPASQIRRESRRNRSPERSNSLEEHGTAYHDLLHWGTSSVPLDMEASPQRLSSAKSISKVSTGHQHRIEWSIAVHDDAQTHRHQPGKAWAAKRTFKGARASFASCTRLECCRRSESKPGCANVHA